MRPALFGYAWITAFVSASDTAKRTASSWSSSAPADLAAATRARRASGTESATAEYSLLKAGGTSSRNAFLAKALIGPLRFWDTQTLDGITDPTAPRFAGSPGTIAGGGYRRSLRGCARSLRARAHGASQVLAQGGPS